MRLTIRENKEQVGNYVSPGQVSVEQIETAT